VCLFHTEGRCEGHQNVLTLRLQPDEGFELLFDVKQPGRDSQIGQIPLAVRYDDIVKAAPHAYETLLADVIEGDQTLFVHADEVEAAWRVYDPLLDRSDIDTYPAGSDGPERAQSLITSYPGLWTAIDVGN
jgi:glucose-6-phosphate 1-dehydrogenase